MSRLDAWLDARIRPHSGVGKPILVLCRTSATAQTVRGWLARRGGLAGIEVATPRALAGQLGGPWLGAREPGDPELPDTAFAARIRERPGLVALARGRVRELRLHRLADPSVRAPAWLTELADSPWQADITDEARLLALASTDAERRKAARKRDGAELTASLAWSRVVALGFHTPLDPWTNAVHHALVGPPEKPVPAASPRVAHGVPDTASEARLAALHAAADPRDTVVLVQHDATATRVHRALQRAGVPSAWRPVTRLERHTLASVIRRCVPWFGGATDPNVRAVDLHYVLRHPMVLGRLPPPAQTWLEGRLTAIGADPTRTALSARAVSAAIRRARHLDAPLSRWIAELEALSARTDESAVAPRALRLLARCKVLDASVRGVPFDEVFQVGGPEELTDWGDFDALVADLLGGQDPNALPDIAPAGTLGALRRFLLACRLRTAEDPASLRILGALRQGAHRPATRLEALQLLQGSVEKGEVHPGVEILAYEDWDGRPCGTLVLCDLHDQGVAARPTPDPLLTDAQIEALGALDGRARVRFRLDQLGRACTRAERVVPIVTARDAMGRAVVPPVQLNLDVQPEPTGTYGLELQGAERPSWTALRAVDAATSPPTCADPTLTHLAIQATAEWSRAARGPLGAPPRYPKWTSQSTLGHHLIRRPTPPTWLGPWLGEAGDVPEARLADAPRSTSKFFNPLAHCLYQAYAKVVLDLREPETISEELDPREIGNAAHDVLEAAALRGAWSHEGEPEAAIEAFTDDLRTATKPAFDKARDRFGALSPARRAATEGLEARWAEHWSLYARNRAKRGIFRPDDRAAGELVFDHRFMDAAVEGLSASAAHAELPPQGPWPLKFWLREASGALARGDVLDTDDALCAPGGSRGLPTRWAPVLRAWLDHPHFKRLVGLWREARERSFALAAPAFATVAELPFGEHAPPRTARLGTLQSHDDVSIGAIQARFGEHTLDLVGFVDRVSLVGDPAAPLLRIVDYKTSSAAPDAREAKARIRELREPQLVIYALAVRQALAEGKLGGAFANGRVATLGWDHVRATDDKRELKPAQDGELIDDATLTELARALGMLVGQAKQGSWPLSPHPRTCPELNGWGHDHCPMAGACRLRAVPASATREEEP